MVWNKMRGFDPSKPVFVESESKKVGQLHIPDALIQAMRQSPCIHVEVPANIRARFLIEEYAHWTSNRDGLLKQIEHIAPLHPKQRITDWKQLISIGDWPAFVESLLIEHYDPSYDRAMDRNFEALSSALVVNSLALDHLAIETMAQQIATQLINQISVPIAESQVTTART
jgi:tRNA 2-selenouridine synthase